ncbi:3-deoxy-7-phosphoheptulonate synthase [Feifania hominis]|uniref:3-deoxy-7-phosphoheptulonate synthase n=1 Tax=Feifania hominis TaxID=2763660 RepID=A0A926DC64_9FIRM|nr:3-deoxy-7-phosphoheptulonate synthase [Feifania hominis]MBC8535868.1 3-deoxy-7-phosphoheptulonate synthase [Feifania hominis]
MIVILKQNPDRSMVSALIEVFRAQGLSVNLSEGSHTTILGLIGDTSVVDIDAIRANPLVADVRRVSEPYKAANRRFHPADTIVGGPGAEIGQGHFTVIAGPCSVESEQQMVTVANAVKKSGARYLRGGAFKPRTSPYAFQGLHEEGIRLLLEAKRASGLPIVTEIMSETHLDLFADVDVIQVGARNMQNFQLLKELGHSRKPILLKRGLSSTIEELLMSAEYILAGGNPNVILCERGIRTFETATRNTLDVSAVAVLKRQTHLPVIVDPSHSGGVAWLVEPLARAAVAAGADGLIIEVHPSPKTALCDGAQSLDCDQFDELMNGPRGLRARAAFEDKSL